MRGRNVICSLFLNDMDDDATNMTVNRRNTTSAGFTYIETLFGVTLFLLIGGVVWALSRDFSKLSDLLLQNLSGQHEVNRTFKGLTSEARTASVSSLGAYPIAEAADTNFTFFSDVDGDGLKERVRYFLDGATLKRGLLVPSGEPLTYNPANEVVQDAVKDVANGATPIFNYYDTSYDGTTPPLADPVDVTDVRLVKMTLVTDKNGDRAPAPTTFTTQISFRNLKDNT